MNNTVVGYAPDKNGKTIAVEANFIFTMLDRSMSKKYSIKKVYRRVDSIAGAWGALFIAAGLTKAQNYSSHSKSKYKGGVRQRTDVKPLYSIHDMRRGFNIVAKKAGLSLDDRASLLGHSREVNESNYCGRPEINTVLVSDIINKKMDLPEALNCKIKKAV